MCHYIQTSKKCSLFIDEFSEFLSILHNSYDMIILTGDFNLHIDNLLDSVSNEFLNVIWILYVIYIQLYGFYSTHHTANSQQRTHSGPGHHPWPVR